MIKIESRSSRNKQSKRIGTTTITFALALSVAAFVLSDVSWAKLPPTQLNSAICAKIGGSWTSNACTIQAGINGVANQPFTIATGAVLDVKGSLVISSGITVGVANSGSIIVENAGGVTQTDFDNWQTGILVYGTLENAGNITIRNVYNGTHTVGISVWASAADFFNPSTYLLGALINSGTINIQNMGETRGIEAVSSITNSASGVITVANNGVNNYSVGIYNRRVGGPFQGRLTNAGAVTISNTGGNTYGIYSYGFLTNSGVLTVEPLSGLGATGIYNGGSFIQTATGTYHNNQGSLNSTDPTSSSWGNYNNNGTMINFGTTYVSGTFLTIDYTMINYGTIYSTSTGAMVQVNGSMLNYGTIYNSGTIIGGKNYGICIDQGGGSGC